MPHYYFHVPDDDSTLDEEGLDAADFDSARDMAIQCARDLMCEQLRKGRLNLNHRIDVDGENGERVLSVPFREAVQLED